MPTVAFWNRSTLRAVAANVASARLSRVKILLGKADVVTIVYEVHPRYDWVEDLGPGAYTTCIFKDPSNPSGVGGVLVVMTPRLLNGTER